MTYNQTQSDNNDLPDWLRPSWDYDSLHRESEDEFQQKMNNRRQEIISLYKQQWVDAIIDFLGKELDDNLDAQGFTFFDYISRRELYDVQQFANHWLDRGDPYNAENMLYYELTMKILISPYAQKLLMIVRNTLNDIRNDI